MSSIPDWPSKPGPKILTLAGNDLTIDVRARKTASSLARSGFSVIAVGIDNSGSLQRLEDFSGAALFRVTPPFDSRISTRVLRISRAELADSLRIRVERQRMRLQMLRRNFTSGEALQKSTPAQRSDLRIWARFRRAGARARLVALQGRHQLLTRIYRLLARPPGSNFPRGKWRRDLPELQKYEAVIGPIVDALRPDLIHVHDIFHLGLATRAKARLGSSGHTMKVVYDAQEFVAGLPTNPKRRAAYTSLEEEYFRFADDVVTVSPSLASLIEQKYGRRPKIVMNAPDTSTGTTARSLRDVAGISEGERIVVYVGGVAPDRGAEELIEATLALPGDTNLVFVCNSTTGYVARLVEKVRDIGLEQRVHFVPYVEPEAVVSYIRSADVSAIPLNRGVLNYEVALPNKLFQSLHARLPVAVSDNPEMERFVRQHDIGEVFEGGNIEAMVLAIEKLLNDLPRYHKAIDQPGFLDEMSWDRQAEALMAVYSTLGIDKP